MPAPAAKLTGDRQTLARLREIGKKSVSINRAAVNKGTTPILQGVKAACPVAHGDLRRAMTRKVTNRGPSANGIVGADAGYVASETTGKKIGIGASKEERNAL